MIRPLRMRKVKAVAPIRFKDRVSLKLHELGATHINDISGRVSDAEWKEIATRNVSSENEKELADYRRRLAELEGALLKYSLGLDFATRAESDNGTDALSRAESLLSECEDMVLKTGKRILEIDEAVEGLISKRDVLDVISESKLKLSDFKGSGFAVAAAYKVKKERFAELKAKLKVFRNAVVESANMKDDVFVLAVCPNDISSEVSGAFAAVEAVRVLIPDGVGTAADEISVTDKRIREARAEKECLVKEVRAIACSRISDVRGLRDEIDGMLDRCRMLAKCAGTDSAFMLEFFVRERDEKAAIDCVLDGCSGRAVIYSVEPLSEELPSKVPVILSNPWVFRPFEGLVKMYSHPKYNDFDPTVLMAPGMMVFFGIMLNDAGYGLLLALAGVLIMKKHERLKMSSGDVGLMLVLLGVSSAIFGVFTGGYFGDGLRRVVPSMPYLLDPLGESHMTFLGADAVNPIITVMIFSLLTGVVFLNIGFLLGIADAFFKLRGARISGVKKAKLSKFEDQIIGHSGMMLFEAGILIGILHAYMGWFSVPLFWVLDLGVVIVSLLMLAKSGGIQTLFGFFDLTGFLGDDLSFIRLLALCLATEGIANVINMFVDFSFGIPYFGVVIGSLLFVFGHMFNLIVGALGAGVHSLRLQYVEFFSKFYEGGGIEFEAFGGKKKE